MTRLYDPDDDRDEHDEATDAGTPGTVAYCGGCGNLCRVAWGTDYDGDGRAYSCRGSACCGESFDEIDEAELLAEAGAIPTEWEAALLAGALGAPGDEKEADFARMEADQTRDLSAIEAEAQGLCASEATLATAYKPEPPTPGDLTPLAVLLVASIADVRAKQTAAPKLAP